MARQTDREYAQTLMRILSADCERLRETATAIPAWSSIVLWEAEEMSRQAETLAIPSDVASEMRSLAEQARLMARAKRRAPMSSNGQKSHSD